jgi:hypothetical protein
VVDQPKEAAPVSCGQHVFPSSSWSTTTTWIDWHFPTRAVMDKSDDMKTQSLLSVRVLPRDAFWQAQVARAREAMRSGHAGSRYALARTLFAAYQNGYDTDGLLEALTILRDLYPTQHTAEDMDVHGGLVLADVLLAEYHRTDSTRFIDEMIHVLESTATIGPRQTRRTLQLARALLERCTYFGTEVDLHEAKTLLDSVTVAGNRYLQSTTTLALYHITRWDMLSQYDLPELQRLRDALVEQLSHEAPGRRTPDTLAMFFRLCFVIYYLREAEATENATTIAQETLDHDTSRFSPSDAFAVTSALTLFYVILGRKNDIWTHMETAQDLIERMSLSGGGRNAGDGAKMHFCRGQWLIARAQAFGATDVDTFKQAAVELRSALRLLPEFHIRRQSCLSGLTYMLSKEWQHSGRRSSLDEIIELAHSYPDQMKNARFVINVTGSMLLRAEAGRLRASSVVALLERSVQLLKAALGFTPEGNSFRTFLLNQLSWAYQQGASNGVSIDKDEHLRMARATFAASLGDDFAGGAKVTLVRVLLDIAVSSRNLEALDESLCLLAQPPYDKGREQEEVVLKARCHAIRYQLLGGPRDLEMSKASLKAALTMNEKPMYQLRNAISCLDVAQSLQDTGSALEMCQFIMGLLPRLAYVGRDIETRIQALQLAEGLASRAAGVALASGDMRCAVELLEQSRGVVWSQALHLRASSTSVPAQHREQFEKITERLSKADAFPADTAQRWKNASDFDVIVDQIRTIDGYQRFLLPRTYPEYQACAERGFVALVVPSESTSDVIIIKSPDSAPCHLQLPALRLPRLQRLAATLKHLSDRSRDAADPGQRKIKMVDLAERPARTRSEKAYVELLGELWTNLVRPVISNLGIEVRESVLATHSATMLTDAYSQRNPTGLRPRLWWCSAGPFAELPLHAAGIYSGLEQDCVANYVVSSYTPTLSALISAQAQDSDPASSGSTVLLVSVPETSGGHSSLPNALVEADSVRGVVPPECVTALVQDQASVDNCLKELPATSVLHLACHGHQSQDDPLGSGFSLHDGRLTLERIMQLQLPKAQLAYLSACETASTDEYQPDEAINLAATMLFVGFRSVIATMWYVAEPNV